MACTSVRIALDAEMVACALVGANRENPGVDRGLLRNCDMPARTWAGSVFLRRQLSASGQAADALSPDGVDVSGGDALAKSETSIREVER
jgi:hypothetical protein